MGQPDLRPLGRLRSLRGSILSAGYAFPPSAVYKSVSSLKYLQRSQQTIARPVSVAGFGYWSGRDVTIEFRPANPDTGIVFVRHDLPKLPRIPAQVKYRVEVPRRTVLTKGNACVEMVEHVLAALAGLRIDNCEIWLNNPELPGCDGSSSAFVEALDQAGILEQNAPRGFLVVTEPMRVADGDAWIEAWPVTQPELVLHCKLDYGIDHIIGRQTFKLKVTPRTFRAELATSRTFIMKSEADWLRKQGLGTRTSQRDLLVFDEIHGPLDNTLRFDDECVRHKTLDMVGDLALAGSDLVGRFVAYRSGHKLNATMVRALLAEARHIRPDAQRPGCTGGQVPWRHSA
jgi:UDP-3-O-acyl N-acetylglucosamine deacetylase